MRGDSFTEYEQRALRRGTYRKLQEVYSTGTDKQFEDIRNMDFSYITESNGEPLEYARIMMEPAKSRKSHYVQQADVRFAAMFLGRTLILVCDKIDEQENIYGMRGEVYHADYTTDVIF